MLPFVRLSTVRFPEPSIAPRARRAARSFVAALFGVSASASCYDWTVRDGATTSDAAVADASTTDEAGADAGAHEGGASDAPTPSDASCDALGTALATATEKARACNFPEACPTTLTDECGCRRFGSKASNSPDITGYATAVSRFLAAGCTPTCGGICQPPIDAGVCLQQGGPKTYCSP